MGIHEIPKRDRSVWWLWVGIFALCALLIYVAQSAFSTSTGAPVAKADQGIQVDANGWHDANQPAPKVSGKNTPKPVPTITLQGYQKTIPGPKITVTKDVKIPVPVPGPTVTDHQAGPTVTKTISAKPAPTVTVTKTAPAAAPAPTVTVTEKVTVRPRPRPTVTVTIYLPALVDSPDPSPSGGG